MAGIVAVIVKMLPDSPQADLEEIKTSSKTALESKGALNISFEEEPIAFGIKAVKAKFAWPEEKDTDLIESVLQEVPHVNSVSIEDYRRAFG